MIILADKYGQLGNRLVYLKAFLAVAMEYDLRVITLAFDEYTRFFTCSSQGFLCGYPPRKGLFSFNRGLNKFFLHVVRRLSRALNTLGPYVGLIVAQPDENGRYLFAGENVECIKQNKALVFLSGWPCVPPDILEKHAEKIRGYFNLTDEYRVIVDSLIADAKIVGNIVVGIHIRQGDYRDWGNGQYYFDTALYLDLMRTIVKKHHDEKVVFVVCTNEPQNWKLFEEFTYLPGPGEAITDMYSLAECDEIYGPPSSFSSWAAFYGERPLFRLETQEAFSASDKVVTQQS